LFNNTAAHFYLFAKIGFTQGCIDEAVRLGNVTMLKFEDMV